MGNFKELDRRLQALLATASQRQAQPTHAPLVFFEAPDEATRYENEGAYRQAIFDSQPSVRSKVEQLRAAGVRTIVFLPDNGRDGYLERETL